MECHACKILTKPQKQCMALKFVTCEFNSQLQLNYCASFVIQKERERVRQQHKGQKNLGRIVYAHTQGFLIDL
jgi:hypothetical protein